MVIKDMTKQCQVHNWCKGASYLVTGFLSREAQCLTARGLCPCSVAPPCSSGTLSRQISVPSGAWVFASGTGNKLWSKETPCENYISCIKAFPFWKIAPGPPAFVTLFGSLGWKMDGIFQHDHFTAWKINFFFYSASNIPLVAKILPVKVELHL